MKRSALLALAVFILSHRSVYADSDGYYCIGPNYIAYQFGLAAPPIAPHKLHIVQFTDTGFSETRDVDLPQFQVHGMRCRDAGIDLAGWDAIHTVRLDSSARPIGRITTPHEPGHLPEWTIPSRNLARLSRAAGSLRPERYNLWVGSNARQLVLDIKATDDPTSKCTSVVLTRLVEFDASSHVLQERIIYQGRVERDCGGPAPAAPQATRQVNSTSRLCNRDDGLQKIPG